jgi:hypothetical protein
LSPEAVVLEVVAEVREERALPTDPEHELHAGVPPAVDTKHRVPAPPVAVVVRVVPFQ